MTHDVIVIGAGPAGMAAALKAESLGLRAVLIDEQPRAGGQIYRNVERITPAIGTVLGKDYLYGKGLAGRLTASSVEQHFSAVVWDVQDDLTVSILAKGRNIQLSAPQLIVATGAMERASPVPGWTLPGVMNAGAAQIAMKSGGSIPSGRIVLAGGGPLLLLVARQLLDAGADLQAVIETSPLSNWIGAARHFAGALMTPKLLAKGLAMMWRLKKSKVPWYSGASNLAVDGDDRATGMTFQASGKAKRFPADMILLHHGLVPNTQISRLLRAEHDWDPLQLCWCPRTDTFGETSVAGLRVAGDGAGIAGALAAEAHGEIAAIGAAHALGRIDGHERGRLASAARRALGAQLRIRPFLDTLYQPPEWIIAPSGDVLVCRCEEVSAAEVARMAKLGCLGPNQTKFFSRCGMGPCQGRICGLPVAAILRRELGSKPETVGAYRVRSPLKPIPLSAIARANNPSGSA